MKMIRHARSTLFFLLATGAQWVFAAGIGPCQLMMSQDEKKWAFDVEYIYETPTWNAKKSAADLLLAQAQYFSGKSSPFIKNGIPPELGYYEPGVSFNIKPFVTYTQTLDGRSCAQVVGAKLIVKQSPEIYLARELAVRNCVSRAALSHQLKHDKAAIDEARAIVAAKEETKKLVFPTYEKQGAAGLSADEIARQLVNMEKAATQQLYTQYQQNLLLNRKQQVETRSNFIALYGSCNGEFQKASDLARNGTEH